MGLEMKGGDLLMQGATLVFILACVTGIFVAFDSSSEIDGISLDLEGYNNLQEQSNQNLEQEMQTLITTDTGFKVKENVYIDERGDAEASLISEGGKSSTTGFINNVKKNKFMSFFDVSIWAYIISIIILVGSIVGLRMVLGNGRI